MSVKYVILTEGHSNPHTAKTACSVIRYRSERVVGLLDATQAGKSCGELLGVGGDLPVFGSLADARDATGLLIGIAPPGGKIPADWRAIILEAIERGMEVVSGLHDFVSDDPEFSAAAARTGVRIHDVRKNNERSIARQVGLRLDCLRVHTVGHDCSVGKMVTSIEVTRGLRAAGLDAKFVATGQTGIMVEGEGLPIDCVVADFVSGAAEKLVLENQHHDILLIEGQGSLVHPSYSSVTLGLLHGCLPHALILCYEVGRTTVTGLDHIQLPPLSDVKRLFEVMANVFIPCEFIGVAMNSRNVSAEQAEGERRRVRDELGVPVCDVFRHGAGDLVEAVQQLYESRKWHGFKPVSDPRKENGP
jgi:uncharacterized NAD-dependent epimerase/dehydratase family protein